jgi:hypothetical protein
MSETVKGTEGKAQHGLEFIVETSGASSNGDHR